MAILKSPRKLPKNETVQIRIEGEIKPRLHNYAEFIGSTDSYDLSEALTLLFRKDDDFKVWLDQRDANQVTPHSQPVASHADTSKS